MAASSFRTCVRTISISLLLLHVSVLVLPPADGLPLDEQSGARLSSARGSTRSNHSRVLIIGAGAAGYAAASRLMENGFYDLTILEAENRIGGRINTVRFAENMVDLGAEWVHGEVGNIVYEMAEPLELLSHQTKSLYSNMLFVWSGGATADPAEVHMLFNTSHAIRKNVGQLRDYTGSYGEWFLDQFNQRLLTMERRPGPDLVDRFLGWFEKFTGFWDGSDTWYNTSGRGLTVYKECEGDLGLAWKRNGYRSLFDVLTKRYPNPSQELPVKERVILGSEVSTIHWADRVYGRRPQQPAQGADNEVTDVTEGTGYSTDTSTTSAAWTFPATASAPSSAPDPATPGPKGPIVVKLSNGGRHTADMVVVTASLGVLKHSADMMFDPPLYPSKINAIRNLGFGQVNKLFMYFSEPWWPSSLSGYSVLVTEEDLEEFKRKYPQYGVQGHWVQGLSGFYIDQHKPNVVLMDWVVGEAARVMERYSDYQIMMGCKNWLEMFLGHNFSIPLPIGFTRSKWWSNPHFRGSYSYRSLDSDRADVRAAHLAEPILDDEGKPAVMFAGEATHDYFYSTVHGAVETGWREADRILKSIGRFRPSSQERSRLGRNSLN